MVQQVERALLSDEAGWGLRRREGGITADG